MNKIGTIITGVPPAGVGQSKADTPRVSVLMTVFNAERYIERAIKSIINQTLERWELLIINDGSTDRSENIAKQLAVYDKRIKVVSKKNEGIVSSANLGLTMVSAPYVARMDADDISHPTRLEKQLHFLEANPNCVAVGSYVQLIDSRGLRICEFSRVSSHREIDDLHMKGHGGAICHPASMMRIGAIRHIGGYDPSMKSAEDLDMFLKLAEHGVLSNIPECLFSWRQHLASEGNARRNLQAKYAKIAVIRAHERRGLEVPSRVAVLENTRDSSIASTYEKWLWWSLKGGNHRTAIKYATLLFFARPISLQTFTAVFCALRGR